MSITLIATCPEDAKCILQQELKELGAKKIDPLYMAVRFEVDEDLYYRVHLKLSTASQIFRVLRECSGMDGYTLHSQAKRIRWHEIFDRSMTYRIDGIAGNRGEKNMTSNEISKQVRIALEDVFQYRIKTIPKVELRDPDVVISVLVRNRRASISVCTSGKTMVKRGYRQLGHPAPLKETLAAALLQEAGYDGSQVFLDPMCGSGNIPIEAAMIATNKACLLDRPTREFGFQNLLSFNPEMWKRIRSEELKKVTRTTKTPIYGSDISSKFVELAAQCAGKAGVDQHIKFSKASFFDLKKPSESGLIVTNLPYGERVQTDEEMRSFYKKLGDCLKKEWTGWKVCFFVGEDTPWKAIGLKPSQKKPFLNGAIKTRFLVFEIYAGTKGCLG